MQPRTQDRRGFWCERFLLQLEPFGGHRLEGLRPCAPLCLALGVIDPVSNQPAWLVALLTCALERYIGIHAEGEKLFNAGHAVTQPPQAAARGSHEQEKAALIEQLVGSLPRLGSADSRVAESRHKWGTQKLF